jgi:hypothetical protein
MTACGGVSRPTDFYIISHGHDRVVRVEFAVGAFERVADSFDRLDYFESLYQINIDIPDVAD